MRKQIEEYLLGLCWAHSQNGWTSPSRHYHVATFDDTWMLAGGSAFPEELLDQGESLGELRLALAGLEAQTTQGAL